MMDLMIFEAANLDLPVDADDDDFGYVFGCKGFAKTLEVCKYLGLKRATILEMCKDGRLRYGRIPNKTGDITPQSQIAICKCSLCHLVKLIKEGNFEEDDFSFLYDRQNNVD